MASKLAWVIRPATKEDIPSILWLTQLLAEYEHEPNALKIGEKELLRDGFGDKPYFHVLVAELTAGEAPVEITPNSDCPSSKMPHNEKIVGHAFYFNTYSTWEGRVLYVEDLFVRKEFRNNSIGSALMQECAKIAVATDCARMQWQALDWNTKAIDLYERMGGAVLKEWLTIRMTQPALSKFAAGEVALSNDRNK